MGGNRVQTCLCNIRKYGNIPERLSKRSTDTSKGHRMDTKMLARGVQCMKVDEWMSSQGSWCRRTGETQRKGSVWNAEKSRKRQIMLLVEQKRGRQRCWRPGLMERTDPANNNRCDYIKKKYRGNSQGMGEMYCCVLVLVLKNRGMRDPVWEVPSSSRAAMSMEWRQQKLQSQEEIELWYHRINRKENVLWGSVCSQGHFKGSYLIASSHHL